MIPLTKVVISEADIQAINKVLRSGNIVQGKKVAELEKRFASLCGTRYAVAISNGTAALHTALHAIGVGPGDEVITTPFTFVATANSIMMVGAKPVFVDIDEKTFNLDPSKIEAAITKKTKAIMPVNLYGQPADYNEILRIAKKHNLFVIEDAAQSIGATYYGKKSGNLADIACFSLYATKNITSGEGGMITTNNKIFADRSRLFRHHGQSEKKRYHYADIGYNYRMTDVFAVLAIRQLKKIEQFTKKRNRNAGYYFKKLKNLKALMLPVIVENRTHVFHQFTIRINGKRDALQKILAKNGIQTNIYYPVPLHYFPHLNSSKNLAFPVTEKVVKEVLSIPVNPYLTKKELLHISETIADAIK